MFLFFDGVNNWGRCFVEWLGQYFGTFRDTFELLIAWLGLPRQLDRFPSPAMMTAENPKNLPLLWKECSSNSKCGRSAMKRPHWKGYWVGRTAFSPEYGMRFPHLSDFFRSRPKSHFESLCPFWLFSISCWQCVLFRLQHLLDGSYHIALLLQWFTCCPRRL